ncbi:MAG: HDIG domain-containing protein [Candidatus Dojkabacteria bacterium]|nr:HDIG domain-containing protein [Candidatus Dojkabacteria bacterium]MDQ7021257.1 HDIG domain-containing protein [Candidatus Dojkabacteria bacterium]
MEITKEIIDDALIKLNNHVKEPYQILHSKMVALAMQVWAKELGEDESLWYLTGLVHDIDYYEHPEQHPAISLDWFREWGYPEDLIHAVEAHAFKYNGFEKEPENMMAAALISCDELSGFLYAYSLMRPTNFDGMEAKGVKKRLKDLNFAAKISRDDINYGVEKFAEFSGGRVDKDKHISLLISVFSEMQELKELA